MKLNAADMIERLTRSLAHDYTLMQLEAPASPLFLAVALPQKEGVTGLKPRLPAGRGMTLQQAMISAGAEALELRASLVQNHLDEVREVPHQGGSATVTATDLLSHQPVDVPAWRVYLDCAGVLSESVGETADSTGCAAGRDRTSALQTALWECVERDAVALWWHGMRPGGRMALDVIDALQPRLFWWLHQRARRTMLLDLTSDIGLPVVAAVSSDADGRMVATGTAARPVLAEAALAAVTEMVQSEVGIELAREAGDPEVLDWLGSASTREQPQFQPAHDAVDRAEMGQAALLQRLAALGHRALGVELTLAEDPLASVRVIVPGLCAMRGRVDTPRFARLCPGMVPSLPEPY